MHHDNSNATSDVWLMALTPLFNIISDLHLYSLSYLMDNGDVVCFEIASQQLWSRSGRTFHRFQQPLWYLCLKQKARRPQQYLRKNVHNFSSIAFIFLLSFYFGGSKLVRFFGSSKCAKIGLSKTIFYDKNHLILSKIDFHLAIISLGE